MAGVNLMCDNKQDTRFEAMADVYSLVPCVVYLLYLCPSLPVEHRPSTTSRYHTLFWAALAIPVQLVPCCFSSASVSRLQLLRGRPLFLFPCGFQVRAWRVVLDVGFLRVCPIQPHFLRSICLASVPFVKRWKSCILKGTCVVLKRVSQG